MSCNNINYIQQPYYNSVQNNRVIEGYFNAPSEVVEDKYLAEYQQFAKPQYASASSNSLYSNYSNIYPALNKSEHKQYSGGCSGSTEQNMGWPSYNVNVYDQPPNYPSNMYANYYSPGISAYYPSSTTTIPQITRTDYDKQLNKIWSNYNSQCNYAPNF
jgi:hypothetical protein